MSYSYSILFWFTSYSLCPLQTLASLSNPYQALSHMFHYFYSPFNSSFIYRVHFQPCFLYLTPTKPFVRIYISILLYNSRCCVQCPLQTPFSLPSAWCGRCPGAWGASWWSPRWRWRMPASSRAPPPTPTAPRPSWWRWWCKVLAGLRGGRGRGKNGICDSSRNIIVGFRFILPWNDCEIAVIMFWG